jgi:hypothetical protein
MVQASRRPKFLELARPVPAAIAHTLEGTVVWFIATSTPTATHHARLDTVAFAQLAGNEQLLLSFLAPLFETKESSGGHLQISLRIHAGSTLIRTNAYANLAELVALDDTTINLGLFDPALLSTKSLSVETLFSVGDKGERFSISYLAGTTAQPFNDVIPEPGTRRLLGLGLALLAAKRRHEQRPR